MRTRALLISLAVACTTAASSARADVHDKAGTTGMSFLKIGVGGRAAAMGGAYTAVRGDQTSSYWNPAGLMGPYRRSGTLMHCQWFQGIHYEYAGWASRRARDAWGVSLAFQSSGELELRGKHPSRTEENPPTFSVYDLAWTLSYARSVGRLRVGASSKVLHEKIHTQDAWGAATDLGVLYLPRIGGLSLGSVLRNVGRMSAMQDEAAPLPLAWQTGAAYERVLPRLRSAILVALDVQVPNDSWASVHAGAEYRLDGRLLLRAGYQTGSEQRNISAGFGIRQGRLQVDYAYVPFYSDLGDTHRISVGWRTEGAVEP